MSACQCERPAAPTHCASFRVQTAIANTDKKACISICGRFTVTVTTSRNLNLISQCQWEKGMMMF